MKNSFVKKNLLTILILIAMVAGITAGYTVHEHYPVGAEKERDELLGYFSIITDVFMRLIKMIIAPLVFCSLVVGVAKQGNLQSVGRVGGKALLWFVCGSFISLFLGLMLVNFFKPGIGMQDITEKAAATVQQSMTLKEFVTHIFPTSIFDALAKNEILQVVVFSLFFGVATAALGEKGHIVIKAFDAITHIILKMTGYIMNLSPFAVFAALMVVVGGHGLGIVKTSSKFIGEFYIGLFMLLAILLLATWFFIHHRVLSLLRHIKEPTLIAFSTTSSEAAFPKLLLELERFGCDEKVVSFVLPLGYSFNLAGSMMYMTFATIFLAQYGGMHMDINTQLSMLMVLMLTSKGIAGVPKASLVVVAGTMATFHIPEAGFALIFAIDPFLDMGRAAMNVIGNGVATAVVCKWEGVLKN
jgi:Na+/H+-dicarboxylate symporter